MGANGAQKAVRGNPCENIQESLSFTNLGLSIAQELAKFVRVGGERLEEFRLDARSIKLKAGWCIANQP